MKNPSKIVKVPPLTNLDLIQQINERLERRANRWRKAPEPSHSPR